MTDEYLNGAGSNYDWIRAFVVGPMLNGKVRLEASPTNTYEFRPERSNSQTAIGTVGVVGALLLGAGLLAAQAYKKQK